MTAVPLVIFTRSPLIYCNDAHFSFRFGSVAGVMTQLREEDDELICGKCVNHSQALAGKHAVNNISYLGKIWHPTLVQAGNIMDASPKKKVLLQETNEREGTTTQALKRVAFTRWLSLFHSLRKLCVTTHCFVSMRLAAARSCSHSC